MCDDPDVRPELFGVGIGPGDPLLITLRAAEVLRSAEVVFAPASASSESSLARRIVEGSGIEPRCYRELSFSMSRDPAVRTRSWDAAAAEVSAALEPGARLAFITLGDPGLYSTWSYLKQALRKRGANLRTETVPGVPTLAAAAAAFDMELVLGEDRLALVPLPPDLSDLEELCRDFDTVVLYKVGRRLGELAEKLRGLGLAQRALLATRVGLPEQTLRRGLEGPVERESGYLSTVILRCGKEAS